MSSKLTPTCRPKKAKTGNFGQAISLGNKLIHHYNFLEHFNLITVNNVKKKLVSYLFIFL